MSDREGTVQLSQPKHRLVWSGLLLILLSIGMLLHFTGYTFQAVDQIYCRGYLPWVAEQTNTHCGQYRSGDDLFENDFIVSELNYLHSNRYQHTYSERIMNGYPIADAYTANRYSFFALLTHYLPATSSINFSALAILFLGLLLGYRIAERLEFSPLAAAIVGVLFIPLSYVALFELWNWALLGYELALLGWLELYQKNRIILGVTCFILSAFAILLSSAYQIYFYTGMNMVLLGLLYFDTPQRKKFLFCWFSLIAIFIGAALAMNFFLFNHYDFLKASNKILHHVSLAELLPHKGYALDPLGWIGFEPVKAHRGLMQIVLGANSSYNTFTAFANGIYSPGPVFLLFLALSIPLLYKKHKGFFGILLFWLLYFSGLSQYVLSVFIGEPFRSETSVRASYLFFLFSALPAVYAFQLFLKQGLPISKKTWFFITAIFSYIIMISLFLVLYGIKHHEFFLEAMTIISSCLLFLTAVLLQWLYTITRGLWQTLLILAFLLPTLGRLFLGVPPGTLTLNAQQLYYPPTTFKQALQQHPELQRAVLIQTPHSAPLHPNTPTLLGLSGVTGYRNPLPKKYMELFHFHRLAFENTANPIAAFSAFKNSQRYVSNDLLALQAPSNKITFTIASKNYFLLHRIDSIIGSQNLEINDPDWIKVAEQDQLTLWKYTKPYPAYLFSRQVQQIADPDKQLTYMFAEQQHPWQPQQTVVLAEPVMTALTPTTQQPAIEMLENIDGYKRIHFADNSQTGILVLPVTYTPKWIARQLDNQATIKTFSADYAFLGLLLPAGNGTIELIYSDTPTQLNKVLSLLGILILISTFLFLRRHFPTGREITHEKPIA